MPTGALEKLRIEAYDKADYAGDPVDTFHAFVNPSEIALGYEAEFDEGQGAGTTGSRMEFKRIKPGGLTLSLFLDGTGANGQPLDVQEAVAQFQAVTSYSGTIHRPYYLKVMWGTLSVKRCVLQSATITYKLFRSDGVPLRAVIKANFRDNSDDETRVAMARDESADLTHVRTVVAGDTLPGLCTQVYGDPRRYLSVARHNRLDDFRQLAPGQRLAFPPATAGSAP